MPVFGALAAICVSSVFSVVTRLLLARCLILTVSCPRGRLLLSLFPLRLPTLQLVLRVPGLSNVRLCAPFFPLRLFAAGLARSLTFSARALAIFLGRSCYFAWALVIPFKLGITLA